MDKIEIENKKKGKKKKRKRKWENEYSIFELGSNGGGSGGR